MDTAKRKRERAAKADQGDEAAQAAAKRERERTRSVETPVWLIHVLDPPGCHVCLKTAVSVSCEVTATYLVEVGDSGGYRPGQYGRAPADPRRNWPERSRGPDGQVSEPYYYVDLQTHNARSISGEPFDLALEEWADEQGVLLKATCERGHTWAARLFAVEPIYEAEDQTEAPSAPEQE